MRSGQIKLAVNRLSQILQTQEFADSLESKRKFENPQRTVEEIMLRVPELVGLRNCLALNCSHLRPKQLLLLCCPAAFFSDQPPWQLPVMLFVALRSQSR